MSGDFVDAAKWSRAPASKGTPNGHGHGLMQIDDRSFPEYCAGSEWKDPASNIEFGCGVLAGKRAYLRTHLPDGLELRDGELERAAVAAYNCGEGNVRQAIERREDPDSRTAGRDYSRSVLAFAAGYRELCDPSPEPPRASSSAPAPLTERQAAMGFRGTLFGLFMKIFAGRANPEKRDPEIQPPRTA